MTVPVGATPDVHRVSIVIPVYKGEQTLPGLLDEIDPFTTEFTTADGHRAVVTEVILSHDNGPDQSDRVIREISVRLPYVKPVWLSRNFGQHAATLAGIASSGGDWVVTMDEDGQHDPAFIGSLLDTALRERAQVVYARPDNLPPHGFVRNTASKSAKRILESIFGGGNASAFNSFRLVIGDVARSVAAYSGNGVYLDVALGWIARPAVTSPVVLRDEGGRGSGYSYRSLMAHFLRMVLTSGTRGLRLVTVVGALFALTGLLFAIYVVVSRLTGDVDAEGWTSIMVLLSLGTGAILMALGIVAEYLGVAVNAALGKPSYLIVRDPESGPLGRRLPGTGDSTTP
ncbi:glycosyltransferase [Aeromicrobium sp. Sec7.5]|uniref:glycosyltransferase n=1 Tax=Aeromicrobium sp. Sec7.5 TaxID=3121276 RepID=UPI002FE44CB3